MDYMPYNIEEKIVLGAINNNGYIDYHKDLGLVQEVFDKDGSID